MLLRRIIYTTILAVGLAGPAFAEIAVDIDLAPPPPRYEAPPEVRPGYVWAPGHWVWREGAHVWEPGHWIAERPGYIWVADSWEQRGPHWHFVPGHWDRDPHWDEHHHDHHPY